MTMTNLSRYQVNCFDATNTECDSFQCETLDQCRRKAKLVKGCVRYIVTHVYEQKPFIEYGYDYVNSKFKRVKK